jgi:WD40 repeat protein
MTDGPKTKVFVSYSHHDGGPLAQRISQDLIRQGWDVWLDLARLTGGVSWTLDLELALDRSEIVLAILSRSSYLSDICRAEQLRSLRKGKCVVPLLAESDAERPIHLESKQYLDFSTSVAYDAAFASLLEAVQGRNGATLNSRFHQTWITVPPLPANYIERTAELQSLRALVLRNDATKRVPLTAVRGMAGIGKTALAQALCFDEVTQAAFPDGIVWIPVGKDPRDTVPLLREAGKALGDSPEGYDSLQSASNRLRNLLRDKSALIVLDDIWDARDVAPFLFDSPRSRLMITTRDGRTAVSLGGEQQELAVFTSEQSLQLISLWSGCDRSQLPPEAADLIRECGCLPLAVAMVGAQLRGKPDRWPHVLQKLRNADLDRIRQSFPEYPHPNLLRAIDVSMEALSEELQRRYLDFGVFPEDCAIPDTTIATLWELDEYDAADTIDQFLDLSLLTREGDRRLGIHDLLLDYLRHRLGLDRLVEKHSDLLERYAQRCGGKWSQGPNDGYFFENLIWHLRSARRTDEALRLLSDFEWVEAKLKASGITSLLVDYDWFASRNENARLLQEALRLSAYVLAMDRNQLAGQLIGRIAESAAADANSMRRQAIAFSRETWLRPLRCLLTPPGGALIYTLASHNARVRCLALTPDGTRAVSASDDQTIKVWDLSRGRLDRTIIGHSDSIRAIAVLASGKSAVSASDDHTLRVWNLSSGTEEFRIDTQLDWILGLVALSTASLVASISDDRAIRVWDLIEKRMVMVLRGHTAQVNCLAAMPYEGGLISGSDDRTLRIWAPGGACQAVLKGHDARITAVAVGGSKRFVSISEDGAARLWSASPEWRSQLLDWKATGVRSATFTHDGDRVIAGSDDGNVRLWHLENKNEKLFEGHSESVTSVAVSPDDHFAISSSDDGSLKSWDLNRAPAASSTRDHSDRVRAVGIASDGLTGISTSDDHTLRLWDLTSHTERSVLRNRHHWVFSCTPEPGKWVLSGGAGGFSLWDVAAGRELQSFAGHPDRVRSLAVTPCGKRIVSGGDDRTIRVWDLHSARELLRIPLVRQWPRAIAVTPDGNFAVTAAESSVLKLWDLQTGAEVRTFHGHTARVNSVAFAPDGRLISGSDDHTVRVWDLGTASPIRVLRAHSARVNATSIFPGGALAASVSDDCDIKLWDLTTGILLATHTVESPVLACAASPCGLELIAGDRSGLVHFVSVEGKPVASHA